MNRKHRLDKNKHTHSRFARYKKEARKTESQLYQVKNNRDVSDNTFKRRMRLFLQRQKAHHQSEIELRRKSIEHASSYRDSVENSIQNEKSRIRDEQNVIREYSRNLHDMKQEYKKAGRALKKAHKHTFGLPSSILTALFTSFGIFLVFVVHWVITTWPKLKMDELIYQLSSPIVGTAGSMILQFVKSALVPGIAFFCLVVAALVFLSKCGKRVRRYGKCFLNIFGLICLVASSSVFCYRLDALTYLKNRNTSSDFIEKNYADPSTTDITFPEKKRNLIFIYLESMEMTYADKSVGGAFDQNVIPELTSLSLANENFSGNNSTLNGAVSLPGTTWTMGGIFASTSGLPLQVDIDGNNMDTQSSFFPGITNLGDILHEQGYNQVFECGSDAVFAGRQLYFQTHGNYDIHDINYFKQQGKLPEDYYVWWGFEDQKLIEYAKEDLTDLASRDEPFNYTMLTVDTHFEDGYVCDLCEDDFGDRYSNVMACSSRQISGLVSWIQQQDWYDDTTIVITGDHPTMDSDFCINVPSDYQRRVYTAYINAAPVENNSEGMRSFSTFDTFPTTIAALGATIEGDRLGLGTNLYSGLSTLMEKSDYNTLSAEISQNSEFMREKASLDKDSAALQNRQGSYPIGDVKLVSYDPDSGQADFSVSDIFNVSEDISGINLTLVDDLGEESVTAMKYKGSGVYQCSVTIPNDAYHRLHLSLDASVVKDGEDSTVNLFDYDGELYLLSTKSTDFERLLDDLDCLDLNRYVVFMTSQGEVTGKINSKEKKKMEELGIINLISEKQPAGYAIIDNNGIRTGNGADYVRENGVLDNDVPFVISSSYNDEQSSSIIVGYDYTDYSPHENGINVVVYDKTTDEIMSAVSYDTGNYGPTASITTEQVSFLNKNIEVSVSDISGANTVSRVLARVYDTTDPDYENEIYLNLDLNLDKKNKKQISLNGKKKTITENVSETTYKAEIPIDGHKQQNLVIRLYVEDTGFAFHYLGTVKNTG